MAMRQRHGATRIRLAALLTCAAGWLPLHAEAGPDRKTPRPARPKPPQTAPKPESVERDGPGRKLFTDKLCASCHTVRSIGHDRQPPPPGPDLSGLGKRMTATELDAWLRKGEPRPDPAGGTAPRLHPLRFAGTDDEWQTLVRWLLALP